MRMKQWSWVAAVVVALSTFGCGGTPERREVSVDDMEQKAAAGLTVNTRGARMKLEQQEEREEARGGGVAEEASK